MFSPKPHVSLDRFARDERGVVAVLFALIAIVLFLAVGLAIDMIRYTHASSKVAAAIDAAALAGAKGLRLQNMSDAEVNTVVKNVFDANLSGTGTEIPTINTFDVEINRSQSSVRLTVDAELPTIFGGFAGVDKFDVPHVGTAVFKNVDIEVSLQLDVTGSMSGSKIEDLKLATKDLIDILIPDDKSLLQGRKIRIGFAPFAAGVNAGSFATQAAGGIAGPDNCVYERKTDSYQNSDVQPNDEAALKTRADVPTANPCPTAQVLPLTDDKDTLKSTVDGYTTGGWTAGHLGTAFAWYLLSPSWAAIWPEASEPSAYGDGRAQKVAILMTDGEYNTVGGQPNNETKSQNYAKSTCSAMKSKNITVYTVGFQTNDSGALSVMRNCASDATKFYKAEDGDELRSAFRAIAEDLATLRLAE